MFPITGPMTARAFREGIIEHYWKGLRAAIQDSPLTSTNKAALPNDYAKIGSFLTDKARVEAALLPLEQQIRAAIIQRSLVKPTDFATASQFTLQRGKEGAALGPMKAHKLLTNALRSFEAENGFNHEKIQNGTFFNEAKQAHGKLHSIAAKSDKAGKLTAVGKEKPNDALSKAIPLARGAPTIIGDLDPLAFNVLLRHGYQFKDVAAGAYHGEYTHRLQWYAIGKANLGLANTLLEIFRSLGYASAKADNNLGADDPPRQLWMWQALFDTAETEGDAQRLRTLAYTTSGAVFTCPEAMNKSLMKLEIGDNINNNPLWCLRLLLKTRWKKRFDEALPPLPGARATGLERVQAKMGLDRTSLVLSSIQKKEMRTVVTEEPLTKGLLAGKTNPKTQLPYTKKIETQREVTLQNATIDNAGYALVWYLRNDDINY